MVAIAVGWLAMIIYEYSINQHCDGAPCINTCKQKAIYKRDNGLVIIDLNKYRSYQVCVDACPTGALVFGDEDAPKIKALTKKVEPLKPELSVKPRVDSSGLPKRFIAGALYDGEAGEYSEGVKVMPL